MRFADREKGDAALCAAAYYALRVWHTFDLEHIDSRADDIKEQHTFTHLSALMSATRIPVGAGRNIGGKIITVQYIAQI